MNDDEMSVDNQNNDSGVTTRQQKENADFLRDAVFNYKLGTHPGFAGSEKLVGVSADIPKDVTRGVGAMGPAFAEPRPANSLDALTNIYKAVQPLVGQIVKGPISSWFVFNLALSSDKRIFDVTLIPANTVLTALKASAPSTRVLEKNISSGPLYDALDGTAVGIRVLIPVSLRNARYTRDKELVGLGKLDLTRQDSMLSVLSPSLSERMKSLDVTDTHQLDEDLKEVYPVWAKHMKESFGGWTTYFLTADLEMPKDMRLKPTKKTPLYNGALECRLFEIKMVSGSNRKPKD